jgi:hypothetical protein
MVRTICYAIRGEMLRDDSGLCEFVNGGKTDGLKLKHWVKKDSDPDVSMHSRYAIFLFSYLWCLNVEYPFLK